MKYYKNPTSGEVYAYEADGSQDEFILPDLVPMTDAEVSAHLSAVSVQLVPNVVTRRQARRALLHAGLLNQVDAAIASIQDDYTREAMTIDWQDATEYKRDDATLLALAEALNLTSAQLDQLFIDASKY